MGQCCNGHDQHDAMWSLHFVMKKFNTNFMYLISYTGNLSSATLKIFRNKEISMTFDPPFAIIKISALRSEYFEALVSKYKTPHFCNKFFDNILIQQ